VLRWIGVMLYSFIIIIGVVLLCVLPLLLLVCVDLRAPLMLYSVTLVLCYIIFLVLLFVRFISVLFYCENGHYEFCVLGCW